MANTYRMTAATGETRRVRSSRFDSFPEWPKHIRPDPSDNLDFSAMNAAEKFAYKTASPVLVVDETDGDRFVGIYGAGQLEPGHRGRTGLDRWVYAETHRAQVADWWQWAADHTLSEAPIWQPIDGEDREFRLRKNRENHNKAIERRYTLLLHAAKIRDDSDSPAMTDALRDARDAAERARTDLTTV